jgi:hypothetical protein
MDDLEQAAEQCWERYQKEVLEEDPRSLDYEIYFRTAIMHKLLAYVKAKLEIADPKSSERGRKLLALATTMVDRENRVMPADMYKSMMTGPWLEDTNFMWQGSSHWQRFLTEVHTHVGQEWMGREYLKELLCIFRAMLNRGANPKTTCTRNHSVGIARGNLAIGYHTVKHVIIDAFENTLPGECAELLDLLQERIEIQRKAQEEQGSDIAVRKRQLGTQDRGPQKRSRNGR